MAFSATTQWDVRTTGNNANGGGFDTASTGTNYAMQDSPQVVYTDLVIGGTTTQCTSGAHPFTAAHVGNVINVTGGTGFTVQRVQIVSVAGVTATCDKSLGTGASTGGTGNLGGALATIATAITAAVNNNTIWMQGTFILTASLSDSHNGLAFQGYATTHGDAGRATITTATNATDLVHELNGPHTWTNVIFSNTAGTPGFGIVAQGGPDFANVANCKFSGFVDAINGDNAGARFTFTNLLVTDCEFTANGRAIINGNPVGMFGCSIHGNSTAALNTGTVTASNLTIADTIFDTNANGSTGGFNIYVNFSVAAQNLTVFGANHGGVTALWAAIYNSIFFSNAGTAIVLTNGLLQAKNNAFGSNGANITGAALDSSNLTGIANPFTASGSGNFGLIVGSALRGAGTPGLFGGSTSTAFPDLGAVQSGGGPPAGGGGAWTFLA